MVVEDKLLLVEQMKKNKWMAMECLSYVKEEETQEEDMESGGDMGSGRSPSNGAVRITYL